MRLHRGSPLFFCDHRGHGQHTDSGLDDMVRRTCVLYEADERGAEFAAQLLADERLTLIVISPGRFISWKEDEE